MLSGVVGWILTQHAFLLTNQGSALVLTLSHLMMETAWQAIQEFAVLGPHAVASM
jgi:hypothetical protein